MNQQRNIPDPIIDVKEANTLDALTERYNKLIEPSKASKALKKVGSKVGEILPEKVKSFGIGAGKQTAQNGS